MVDQLMPLLVLSGVVIFFVVVSLSLTFIAGPQRKITPAKQMPYECGIIGDEQATTRFPIKFYLTAILFILFDIEVVFLYPWALIFTDFIEFGPFILLEMFLFVGILTYGLFYVWKANALDWD